jgi:hypothetical protein
MADGIVGQPFTRAFRTGITGQTLTIDPDTTTKPDGTAFTPTITPSGVNASDAFSITFTPDQAGIWVAEATDDDGRRFRGEYEILAVPSKTFTRRAGGQTFNAAHINELQQRLEELPF